MRSINFWYLQQIKRIHNSFSKQTLRTFTVVFSPRQSYHISQNHAFPFQQHNASKMQLIPLSTIFQLHLYMVAVSFLGEGNRSNGENQRPAASH